MGDRECVPPETSVLDHIVEHAETRCDPRSFRANRPAKTFDLEPTMIQEERCQACGNLFMHKVANGVGAPTMNNMSHVSLSLSFSSVSLSLSRYQAKSKLRPDQGPSRLHDSETQEMNGCARQMRSIFKRVEGKETVQNQSPLGWRPSQAGWRPSLLGLQAIDSSLVSRSRTPVERPWRRSHWLKPSALGSAAKWSDDSAGEFCSLAKLRCQRALCLNAALCRPQGRHLFTCNRRMIRL